jgi:hypothetical protein
MQKARLPPELLERLRKDFGDREYRIDKVYEDPPGGSGPGEPRWFRYYTVVSSDGLRKSLVGIFKELIFVDGPSGDYGFIPVSRMTKS